MQIETCEELGVYYAIASGVLDESQYETYKGYEHFEFMDAGLPFKKFGYRDFILGFGGKQMSTRRWFRFRWTWLNKIVCWLYR